MVTQFPILRIDRTTIQFVLYYTTLIIVCQVLFCDFCYIFNYLTACSLCKIVNELLQYNSIHQKSGWLIDSFILLHRLTSPFNLQREQKTHPSFSIGAICLPIESAFSTLPVRQVAGRSTGLSLSSLIIGIYYIELLICCTKINYNTKSIKSC